uniref:Uncharacterized protein n=1 Tax=Timema cristinae TaxID=61476 RepID=A0A7R9GW14_TIMCR|nr:unnamed protein product [Timema cristinae]
MHIQKRTGYTTDAVKSAATQSSLYPVPPQDRPPDGGRWRVLSETTTPRKKSEISSSLTFNTVPSAPKAPPGIYLSVRPSYLVVDEPCVCAERDRHGGSNHGSDRRGHTDKDFV